ncbi:hypothetical protein [Paenibacillus sp. R14(2021)]|uniref:hypothetical protein n=1 Tax=Paenibacillus sp. R14(2021) TaxID=2859228 RepID=UPI001C61670D|nr:hypothetical protein [Paenibacillus sp. R14(2021)]
MQIKAAKQTAIRWVMEHASTEIGFRGAYFSGSTIGMSDWAELPPSSDIDIVIVTAGDVAPPKLGKFLYSGVLLEVTYLSRRELASAEEVLGSYHLAGSFRMDTIIADPEGYLRKLQADVARHYAEAAWVRRRCSDALLRIENGLRAIDADAPLHDKVTSWLFPTGVTTHVILVAALRNPTVRLRYLAARETLADYGQSELYSEFMRLLGCTNLTPERAEAHLDELSCTFDLAAAAGRTPFFFSSDITPAARSIAIDGSRALIQDGSHREAVFWIIATFARCHKILAADAPGWHAERLPAFQAAIAELGITSTAELFKRAEAVTAFLPALREAAEAILSNNPAVVHGTA